MSVKRSIEYGIKTTFDLVVATIVAWIVTHVLDDAAKRVKAIIDASDGKTLTKIADLDAHVIAYMLGIHPAEVKFSWEINKKFGILKGSIIGLRDLMKYAILQMKAQRTLITSI